MDPSSTYSFHSSPSWSKLQDGKVGLDVILDLLLMSVPIWLSILVGLILGWSWRPRWVSLLMVALRSRPRLAWSMPPGFGARRLWLAATAATAAPFVKHAWDKVQQWVKAAIAKYELMQQGEPWYSNRDQLMATLAALVRMEVKSSSSACEAARPSSGSQEVEGGQLVLEEPTRRFHVAPGILTASSAATGVSVRLPRELIDITDGCEEGFTGRVTGPALEVTESDLANFCILLEDQDDGPAWEVLMEKSAPRMSYTAWRRDPQAGPTEYRSRSVIENCGAELVRDFFWDDDFRSHWDDMLTHSDTIESCPATGYQVVRWIRKFPFFCKDREYVIGRRIWAQGDTFFCITKGIDHGAVERKNKPRRVDVFYSSWRIRNLEDGSCEVLLFHKEDMGIQRDLAKLGIRQGMWAAVRKIEPGVRKYSSQRESGKPMSRSASFAGITTPLSKSPTSRRPSDRLGGIGGMSMPNMSHMLEEGQEEGEEESQGGSEGAMSRPSSMSDCSEMGSLRMLVGDKHERKPICRGRRRRVAMVVAGSLVAVFCGVDKALIAKIVLARFAQQLVTKLTWSRK